MHELLKNEIADEVKRLALAFLAYESDEPRYSTAPTRPGYLPVQELVQKNADHFIRISWEEFEAELNDGHSGDCTCVPGTCLVCHYEYYLHKALWIAKEIGISGGENGE